MDNSTYDSSYDKGLSQECPECGQVNEGCTCLDKRLKDQLDYIEAAMKANPPDKFDIYSTGYNRGRQNLINDLRAAFDV